MIDFRTAIRDALDLELSRNEDVVLFGEDIAFAGGVFQATAGLNARHGDRVFDTPISELALAGAAFGAAVTGMRPIIEIMFGDFMTLAMDSLVNQAAKYWSLSNGQRSVPLVIRTTVGAGGRFGAIHSQNPANWLMSVPGLKLVAPAFPGDAGALLTTSIRDDDPVVFLEHKRLYTLKGEPAPGPVSLGKASVVVEGNDLTLVSVMMGVHDSVAAATELSAADISVEVIDLRTLRPWDLGCVLRSVAKTKRLIVVDEGPHTGGWPAEVLASVAEANAGLEVMQRLTAPDEPLPYSPPLEDAFIPRPETIVAAVEKALRRAQKI